MDIDKMQTAINVAMIESALTQLQECKTAEMDAKLARGQKQVVRYNAVNRLDSVIKLLRGEVVISDSATADKLLKAFANESQFLEFMKEHKQLTKELALKNDLIDKLKVKAGTGKKKKAKAKAKAAPKKKKAKAKPKKKDWKCPDCGNVFKTERGLKRHFTIKH